MNHPGGSPRTCLILTHARSGSSRLARILDQHPDIFSPGEIFNWRAAPLQNQLTELLGYPYDPGLHDPQAFLHTVTLAQHARTGKHWMCAKVIGEQVPESVRRSWLKDTSILKIILWRENLLEAAISREIVIRVQKYNIAAGKPPLSLKEPFAVDTQRMRNWMTMTRVWMHMCRTIIAETGQNAVMATYETFGTETVRGICNLLGVWSAFPFVEPFQKFTRPHEHFPMITNLDEVHAKFGDGEFGKLPDLSMAAA